MATWTVPAAAQAQDVRPWCDVPGGRDSCGHWYSTPWVSLSWDPDPGGMQVGTCPTGTFTSEMQMRRFTCTVQWSGTTETREALIGIDRTPPAIVSLQPGRPPDYNGWFNHPVGLTFKGQDAVSGIASCTSMTFGGPEGHGVTVSGTCTDQAGHTRAGAFPISYDATPPPAPSVAAMPGDGRVGLLWTTAADSQAEVLRTSAEEPPAVVYRGSGGGFTDGALKNERRYRYVVTLIDQAGNRASGGTSAVPTASKLLLPSKGARLGRRAESAPLLVWKAVRRARYYNVQIFRGGKKILSAWPKQPRLQLKREWRYRGKRYHLLPARYCWRVWPGFGKRSAHRYGKQLGRKCFRVTR